MYILNTTQTQNVCGAYKIQATDAWKSETAHQDGILNGVLFGGVGAFIGYLLGRSALWSVAGSVAGAAVGGTLGYGYGYGLSSIKSYALKTDQCYEIYYIVGHETFVDVPC